MELPIDHFRLLGVNASADPEEVLRFFHLRLDRPPEQGFTPEVLDQRSELLRRSADLLCDNELRKNYETDLLNGALGLELSSNREVAGLILLWEAGNSFEAFKLARKSLQPPQAPALGSGRESDLTLLAALSCSNAASQEKSQRHYSSAAELLEEGIQLLQRMGKLPDHRQSLEKELEELLPYRILDLLSRNLSDQKSHQDGINLLDGFVLQRGGLEGRKIDLSYDLKQSDFEIFFQQIRKFLTVQEQIDLFSHWYKNGSSDAGFLYSISLVASGFSRRKPESLKKARKQISKLNLEGFDAMPLLGCIELLLANVSSAEEQFAKSSDLDLRYWLDSYPGEKLAALCDYCRNWLKEDVLIGFRDIDVDSVDLEAWFADRDVQDYIAKIDRRGAFGMARAGFSFVSGRANENPNRKKDFNLFKEEEKESLDNKTSGDSLEEGDFEDYDSSSFILLERITSGYRNIINNITNPLNNFSKSNLKIRENKLLISSFLFIFLFFSGGVIGWLSIRDQIKENNISTSIKIEDKLKSKDQIEKKISDSQESLILKNKSDFKPLIDKSPSKDQILELIEVWLLAKADILSGGQNKNLPIVARNTLVKIVNEQRSKDKDLGEKQIIKTKIESINIEDQTNKRIAVKVIITYQDKRIKESGEVVSETNIPSLTVKYILGREKNLWQLVNFSSGT
ncbi:IMS domain-containing protein [Prochlorococcus marinus]|uniref:IMS domain-containing protein n=1 Tax=Prochlorococcus marinus TaxID=1219 RepID=UPI0022B41303|nr:IMS domain-containing protein [Prochlorococcus marinus]